MNNDINNMVSVQLMQINSIINSSVTVLPLLVEADAKKKKKPLIGDYGNLNLVRMRRNSFQWFGEIWHSVRYAALRHRTACFIFKNVIFGGKDGIYNICESPQYVVYTLICSKVIFNDLNLQLWLKMNSRQI